MHPDPEHYDALRGPDVPPRRVLKLALLALVVACAVLIAGVL